jgi:hypothetical protein
MSHFKNSILLTVVSILSLLSNVFLGLLFINLLITYLGPDYNGLNLTINQFVSSFIIFEGGLTILFTFNLLNPIKEQDTIKINSILSLARKKFLSIGLIILLIAFPSMFFYSFLIRTNIPIIEVIILFSISIISTFTNISFSYKYQIIIEANNLEYIPKLYNFLISQIR